MWGDAAADCRSAREGFYDATVEQVRAILKIGMTPLFFLVKKNSSALTLFLPPPLHPPPPPPLSFPSTLPNTTNDAIPQYALQPTEKLSLQQMLEVGRSALLDSSGKLLLASARQAQRELPKRLARRLMDLQLLPFIVVSNPHIRQVYDAYRHAFDTLTRLDPVENATQNREFTELLRRLVDEHAPMLDLLASGLREVDARPFAGPRVDLDSFLDAMLRSRVSRRRVIHFFGG